MESNPSWFLLTILALLVGFFFPGIPLIMLIARLKLGPRANHARQEETYQLPEALPQVHVRATHAVHLARLRLVEAGPQHLKADSRISGWSWGVTLEVWMEPHERGTLLTLVTAPLVPGQTMYFAQSLRTLRRFVVIMELPPEQRVEPELDLA